MKRFAFGFTLGVLFVFAVDAVVYEAKRERRKRANERLPFTRWETQDWEEDDPDVRSLAHRQFWEMKTPEFDWDAFDEWLAGS